MTSCWHLLTGEYPPTCGGIGQFVSVMADALADTGAEVHVWTPGGSPSLGPATVHILPDEFGPGTIVELEAALQKTPGRVVLHYTPNALGTRGANLRFCRWFALHGRQWPDTHVFFHEPFMYFGRQSLARNALALVHRVMAATLLRASDEVYLSTPSWEPLLQRYSVGRRHWVWIPVSVGTVPRANPDAIAAARSRLDGGARWLVGSFGTYAAETTGGLRSAIVSTLAACPDAHIVCLGRNSREFARSLGATPRVSASGEIADEDLSAAIAACDLILQPFPEGVTCRRTSLLRTLASGAAVITTTGLRTEPIWQETGAVALVPAANPCALGATAAALLDDPAARERLSDAARRTYEASFSPAALIRALAPWTPASFASCS